MESLESLEFDYPSMDESRRWIGLLALSAAVVSGLGFYWSFAKTGPLEFRFRGVFKLIFNGWTATAVRLGFASSFAILALFFTQMILSFVRYDQRRRIVLDEFCLILPVAFDDLIAKSVEQPEVFIFYSDIEGLEFEEEDLEVTYIHFKARGQSYSIARRRLSNDQFNTVCIHLAERVGRNTYL